MGLAIGTFVEGKVVVDGLDLPEGTRVSVLTPEPDATVRLSPEEEAALLEAMAEAERGETICAEELFARLDRIASP
jgi:reverse gyrase